MSPARIVKLDLLKNETRMLVTKGRLQFAAFLYDSKDNVDIDSAFEKVPSRIEKSGP